MEQEKVTSAIKEQTEMKGSGFFDSVVEPPAWLTQSYVEDILKKKENDRKLQITKYSTTTCTKPGDAFVGVIFRAHISHSTRGEERMERLIFKMEPFLEGVKKDMIAGSPIFKTEGRIYTEVLPIMQELLKNIKDLDIIAPTLIHSAADPDILIIQDITPEGFQMEDSPVPFPKASQIAKKLAKFHALSYFMVEERGDTFLVDFQDSLFSEKLQAGPDEVDMIASGLAVIGDVIREWDVGMEVIANKLEALRPNFYTKLREISKPSRHGINVLNHGDFHIKNLLFRFDDKQTTMDEFESIRIIDFQLSSYGTPALDLSFLLHYIADAECNEKHRNELLSVYHKEFVDTLTKLGYLRTPPSLLDLQVELLKNGLIEVYMATCLLKFHFLDIERFKDADWSDEATMNEINRATFNDPKYKSLLMRLLPEFLNKGLLDV